MRKLIAKVLIAAMLAIPCLAQEKLPDAPQPQPVVTLPTIQDQVAKPEKSHNFFWNKINTPIFVVQAAGAFWMAREINGNASDFTASSFWHRYLPNTYREAFGVMVAGDAVAYGFHKAHFKHHEILERVAEGVTAGALYITAERYLKSYNKQDCLNGLTQFCH